MLTLTPTRTPTECTYCLLLYQALELRCALASVPAADAQARTRFSSTDPPPLLTSIRTSPAREALSSRRPLVPWLSPLTRPQARLSPPALSRRFGHLEPRATSMRLATTTPATTACSTTTLAATATATPATTTHPTITHPTTTPPTATPHGDSAPSGAAFPGYHPCTLLSEVISLRTIRFGASEGEGGTEVDPNPYP